MTLVLNEREALQFEWEPRVITVNDAEDTLVITDLGEQLQRTIRISVVAGELVVAEEKHLQIKLSRSILKKTRTQLKRETQRYLTFLSPKNVHPCESLLDECEECDEYPRSPSWLSDTPLHLVSTNWVSANVL